MTATTTSIGRRCAYFRNRYQEVGGDGAQRAVFEVTPHVLGEQESRWVAVGLGLGGRLLDDARELPIGLRIHDRLEKAPRP
jgi:hypothetical protein